MKKRVKRPQAKTYKVTFLTGKTKAKATSKKAKGTKQKSLNGLDGLGSGLVVGGLVGIAVLGAGLYVGNSYMKKQEAEKIADAMEKKGEAMKQADKERVKKQLISKLNVFELRKLRKGFDAVLAGKEASQESMKLLVKAGFGE
ncbi:MAG: hypothetical protein Fur0027_22950 [Raineya sp.]